MKSIEEALSALSKAIDLDVEACDPDNALDGLYKAYGIIAGFAVAPATLATRPAATTTSAVAQKNPLPRLHAYYANNAEGLADAVFDVATVAGSLHGSRRCQSIEVTLIDREVSS